MKKLSKIIFILGLILVIVATFFAFKYNLFQNPMVLKKFVHRFGFFGPVIFIVIQIIQPIVPIIPGGVSDIAGVLSFGNVLGVLYASFGLVLGEIILFLLVRKYGRSFVLKVISDKNMPRIEKLVDLGNEHTIWMLIIVFLMPFGPDDLACLAAGFTDISLKDYVKTLVILKPISVAIHCYLLLDVFKMVKIT